MTSRSRSLLAISALLLASAGLSGCEKEAMPLDPNDAGQGGDGDGDGDGDGGTHEPGFLAEREDGWLSLIEGDWELDEAEESYRCVRVTVEDDVYISAIKPLDPLGTHHTVLSINEDPDGEPDGLSTCDAFENATRQLAATGVGTGETAFPDGIAVKLPAGSQLILNLHLFNAGEGALRGRSGVWIKAMDEEEVTDLADTVLAGSVELSIPPGQETVEVGTCTITQPATIFAVFPHMHQLGIHLKVTANSSVDGEVVLYDDSYSFDEQVIRMIPEVQMETGDTVDVECTYFNDREEEVMWGDSSLAEMCFAGLWRYPQGDPAIACFN